MKRAFFVLFFIFALGFVSSMGYRGYNKYEAHKINSELDERIKNINDLVNQINAADHPNPRWLGMACQKFQTDNRSNGEFALRHGITFMPSIPPFKCPQS